MVANYYYASNLKTGGIFLMVVGTKDLLDHLKERIDHIEQAFGKLEDVLGGFEKEAAPS